jgi:hypothetical protein
MIATRSAILLIASTHIENGMRVSFVAESVMYRWGLLAF